MVSVIIPARNAAATLPRCLEALAAQVCASRDYEVIVVDDGSTDDTAQVARRYGARCISMPASGPAAARNRGAADARGDLILFTDADCEPAPDWIERLTAPFADPRAVGAKGVYRTRERGLTPRFVQVEYEDKYDRMARRDSIDFIDTYSAAYRRSVFLENGGFETAFPVPSVEDQEFSFRLAHKGYRLVFVPEAIIYHRHDLTLAEYAWRKFWIGYWKAFLLRWHPERALADSHTPLSQRLQIGLVGAAGLGAVVALAAPLGLWLGLGMAALFALSTLPFLRKIARRDPAVLALAPLLLIVRAAALGVGLLAGFVGLARRRSPRRSALGWLNRALKRTMDVALSLVGLIVTAPIIALLGIAIRLDSPGPIFFGQERVGEAGRAYRMWKLRSMVHRDPMPGPQVLPGGLPPKSRDDPRVTRVGRFARRWSLDELPQLWNVLRGDMSLVGPRPEETFVVAQYSDWHRQRLAVKPGLTGPMQVDGRADLALDSRVTLELDYIQHYSIWRDIVFLARTLPAVIRGRGAY